MGRQGRVFIKGEFAGIIEESADGGYRFTYDTAYRMQANAVPVSLTLPLATEIHEDKVLFPFFDGLIPEGWMLDLATSNWKLKANDRMGLLLAACRDCIGAVHVEPIDSSEKTS